MEKFIQELAWRDYWQQVWLAKGDEIFTDLKHPQTEVEHHQVPKAIIEAETGIEVIDEHIEALYETGYMHNHVRMYTAALACNFGKSHWLQSAQWMYAHLLDGDLASNHLSWQWVCGANANKKYYANQDNVNKYTGSSQKGTFMDRAYEEFYQMDIPEKLKETKAFELTTELPEATIASFENRKTLVYNYYNLDPYWHKDVDVQRVLLLEPSVFSKHPVSKKCLDFAIELACNIPNIKLHVGEYSDLVEQIDTENIHFKEHPLNSNYRGIEEARDWMTKVEGYYPSFFSFWKKAQKELKAELLR